MTGFSKLIIYRDGVLINDNVTTSPWSDPDILSTNSPYVYTFYTYDSSGIPGSTVSKTFYTLPDLTELSVTSFTASQIVLEYTGTYTTVNITRNGTSVATNLTGTTFTDTGLTGNTSYTYIVTPIGTTGSVGTTLTTTKITLPNITSLNASSTDSQIVLAYDGSYTNVSITRDGSSIATNITGTTFTNTGLTSHTSYTYILTPYNSDGLVGSTISITKGTLPSLSSLSVSSYTSTQIVLEYTGSYTNVSITRDGSSVATNITGTSFTNTGLSPNVEYTYVVTPNNSTGAGSTLSITQCTLPIMTSISGTSFPTQIVLEYTGIYTNVSITRDGSSVATNITGTSFTDTGLSPHTSYTYIVTPYNSLGYAGTTISITKGTLPMLTSLSVTSVTSSQVVLTYGGNYTNVSITRDGSSIATNITGTTFTDTGLTANVEYTYAVTPNNSSGSGTSVTIIQKTLPDITAISILSETTAQIVLSYSGNFTYVSITRDGSYIATGITTTSYTDVGLTPNTSYTYIVTPYNSVGTGSTATITNVTLPNMTSISISSETTTSIVLAYTGNYETVTITRDGSSIATNITGTTFTDTGLTVNTTYVYVVTPKNSEGDVGTASTITNNTSGLISSFSVSDITTTQIVLTYTGNYTNVSITRDGSSIATNITGTTFTDTGLTVNTSYVYVITPYDLDGDAGITSSVTQSTLANIVSFGITSETDTSIVLNFSGNYISVNITRDGSSIATGVTTTTYTDSGLTANTSYTYIVTPVNSSGNLGTASSSIIQKTLPSLTSVTISSRTTTQIVLALSGNYTSVNITRGITSIATGVTASTYTDSSLTANTAYVYVVTPINSAGAGTAITSTLYTLPSLSSVTEGTIDSESIGMTFSGLYSYVIVTRTDDGIISDHITETTYTDYGLSANTLYSYTIVPYTVTSVAGESVSFSATTEAGIALLTSLTTTSETETQIVLAYTGSYISVSITRDGSSIATGITTSTYTDTGLTVNTSYTYVVTPYNTFGAGTASTITKNTLPNITTLSVSSFTTTQIVLAYTGNFTNVSITRDGSSIATGVTATTYTDTGLTANTSYTYIVTPYNSDGTAGTTTATITKNTLSSMTSISVSSETDTQIVLAYTGNFTNVSITRDGTSIATGVTTSTYTDASGLTANTSYVYIVTPYNATGIIGTATVTITTSTLPIMTLSVSSKTDTQIVLAFSGSYTNVSITRDGSSIATNVIGSTYTDVSGLSANTSYLYVVTPYNSGGSAGTASSITQSTLSNITSLSVSDITTTQIVLSYTGIYTNVSISRDGTDIASGVTDATYTDSGLSVNTSYEYIVTPNGLAGVGTTSTITRSTLPNITGLSVTSATTSQIVFAFSGNYTSLSITQDETIIETSITGTTYTDSGLTANRSYTYIFTPYNSDSTAGSTFTITQRTLSNITSLSISSFTDTQIVLAYDGSYTNVSITRDGSSIATNITGITYTDASGLSANTSYLYVVTPNDASGNPGTSSSIIQTTLPTVTSLSITSVTVSQIVLAFSGNYTNVSITRDGSSVATDISGTTYTDTGLTGNTEYVYIVTPYNSVGVPSTTSTITQTTLPNLTSLITSDVTDTQIVLAYTGNFTNVSITRDGSSIATDISGTTYTDSGLTANSSYTYIVTPHNSVGTGTSSTITKITLSNVTSLSVSSFTVSQIVLAYDGSYTNVSITRDGSSIATNITGTTFTDTGLSANTSYTYIVSSYNSDGIVGTTSTITKITLPNLTSLSVSSFTTSQIVLAFSGNYTNVSITRDGSSIATGVIGTTYIDASGLSANTSYTYIVTPYNTDDIAGSTSTITQSTLTDVATLTSLSNTSKTASQIVFAYTGNYTNVSITRDGSSIATGITASTYTDASGLSANTSYEYIFTPYNSSNTAGTISSITIVTLPTLTSLSITDVTASQISLAFPGSFTNVSITRDGSSIATGITDTTYIDASGLTAYTSYTYIVTPQNSSGDSGTTLSITQNTSPILTSFTVSNVSTTEIGLAYDGSYTNVSITRDGSSIATNITGTTFADTGLSANTSYVYIITPNDASGNSGSTLSLTKSTLPSLTSLTISGETASQIVLAYTGNYTNVSITRDGTAIASATQITGTTFTDTDLSANTSYTYVVTPYNSTDISGATLSITHSTLPNVTSLSIFSYTVSQIVLAFSGNYTNVSITRDGSSIITGLTASTYTDTGLTGNTAYVYSVIPYNASNVAGSDSTITQLTLPIISSLSVSSKTDVQIIFGYSGNYTDVSITRDGSPIASHVSGISYTDTGLIGNTSYAYVFTPYNSSNIAGSTSSLTVVTLPIVNNGE